MLRAFFLFSFWRTNPVDVPSFPSFSSYYAAVSNLIPRLFSPIPSPLPFPRPPVFLLPPTTATGILPLRPVPFRSVRGRFARALLSLLSSLLSLHSNYPPLSHSRVAYNSLPRYPSRPLFPAFPLPSFPAAAAPFLSRYSPPCGSPAVFTLIVAVLLNPPVHCLHASETRGCYSKKIGARGSKTRPTSASSRARSSFAFVLQAAAPFAREIRFHGCVNTMKRIDDVTSL